MTRVVWDIFAAAIASASAGLLLVSELFPGVASASPDRIKQPEAYQQRLVDWLLEDPEAFFHPSILWKRLPGDDGRPTGPYAMHSAADIPQGTPLIILPRKYVLESHEEDERPDVDEWERIRDPRFCTTLMQVLEEYNEKGDESFYDPYLSYLFKDTEGGTTRGLLPGSWSDHGLEILNLIIQYDDDEDFLYPADLIEDHPSVFDFCEKVEDYADDDDVDYESDREEEHQQAEDAYLFLLSRGWDDKLLPIIDMVNHGNGPGRNVEITPISTEKDKDDVGMYAWKDIAAGEQLLYTYTECFDDTCHFGASKYSASTQYIFAEYGFLEPYPQRWQLNDDGRAEITTFDANDETKTEFRWIFETPTTESILWIERHLDRLKKIETEVRKGVADLEATLLREGGGSTIHNFEHERDTILELYEGYIRLFELALKHRDDPVAVTEESFWEEVSELKKSAKGMTIEELRKHELLSSSSETHTDGRNTRETVTADDGEL